MAPVKSSNVEAVGFDSERRVMHVRFRSGGTYELAGVTSKDHADMMGAPSHGKHFHARLKGRFVTRKLA